MPDQKPSPPPQTPDQLIAEAVVNLSQGVQRLLAGPLKQDTIVLLLHDATGVPKRTIKQVLAGLQELRRRYVK